MSIVGGGVGSRGARPTRTTTELRTYGVIAVVPRTGVVSWMSTAEDAVRLGDGAKPGVAHRGRLMLSTKGVGVVDLDELVILASGMVELVTSDGVRVCSHRDFMSRCDALRGRWKMSCGAGFVWVGKGKGGFEDMLAWRTKKS